MSQLERGEQAHCEQELGAYLQDCEDLVRQMQLDLQILRNEKYYQVEQLAFRCVRGRISEGVNVTEKCHRENSE